MFVSLLFSSRFLLMAKISDLRLNSTQSIFVLQRRTCTVQYRRISLTHNKNPKEAINDILIAFFISHTHQSPTASMHAFLFPPLSSSRLLLPNYLILTISAPLTFLFSSNPSSFFLPPPSFLLPSLFPNERI